MYETRGKAHTGGRQSATFSLIVPPGLQTKQAVVESGWKPHRCALPCRQHHNQVLRLSLLLSAYLLPLGMIPVLTVDFIQTTLIFCYFDSLSSSLILICKNGLMPFIFDSLLLRDKLVLLMFFFQIMFVRKMKDDLLLFKKLQLTLYTYGSRKQLL